MIGHLGARVSALLDGQLPPAEAEEAWLHVYACHACRDLVEREGWIKSQLAGLSGGLGAVPDDLKGALRNVHTGSLRDLPPGERFALDPRASAALPGPSGHGRRAAAMVGGGAAGAAMLGVLAFGLAPASTPVPDRRPPTSGITTPSTPPPSLPASFGGTSSPRPSATSPSSSVPAPASD